MSETLEVLGPGASPPELASVANREHALVSDAAGSMVEHAIRAGEALGAAKTQVNHGGWVDWLEANFQGSRRTAERYMRVAANAPRVAHMDLQGLPLRAIDKRLARIDREQKATLIRERGVEVTSEHGGVEIRHGDLRDSFDDLLGQVDAVITDPPYPAEFFDEYDALSELAARILKPDGVLVAMVGQAHLPTYLERLSGWLIYRWCGSYLTEGPATRIHDRKVGTKWKPILIFDLGGPRSFITQDVFSSSAGDKDHHEWGQSESGMADLVERFTAPGQLVVDPFLGAGTTAIVCRDKQRRFIGCDIDAAAVDAARRRLA